MAFLDNTGIVASIITGLTNDVTGSLFLTYLMIIFLLVVFAIALRIPIEYTVIVVFPVMGVILAYNGDFLGITGAFAIYLAIIIAKNFFISRS